MSNQEIDPRIAPEGEAKPGPGNSGPSVQVPIGDVGMGQPADPHVENSGPSGQALIGDIGMGQGGPGAP